MTLDVNAIVTTRNGNYCNYNHNYNHSYNYNLLLLLLFLLFRPSRDPQKDPCDPHLGRDPGVGNHCCIVPIKFLLVSCWEAGRMLLFSIRRKQYSFQWTTDHATSVVVATLVVMVASAGRKADPQRVGMLSCLREIFRVLHDQCFREKQNAVAYTPKIAPVR